MLRTVCMIRSWAVKRAESDKSDTSSGYKKEGVLQSEINRYIFIYYSVFVSPLSDLSDLSD